MLGSALASPSKGDVAKIYPDPIFLSKTGIDVKRVLAPPPLSLSKEDRADLIAEDRVLAGVHHPSDIEAGKKLGDAVFKKLLSNPMSRKELDTL